MSQHINPTPKQTDVDLLDSKIGNVGSTDLQAQITSLNSNFTTVENLSGTSKTTVSGQYLKVGRLVIICATVTVNEAISANEVILTGAPAGNAHLPIVGFKHASGERGTAYLCRTDDSNARILANDALPVGAYVFSGAYLSRYI